MSSLDNDVVTACFVGFPMSREFRVSCYEFDVTVGKCSVDITKDKVFNSLYSIAIANA